ncbi:hypothetical protein [Micromonospora sp. CPCC 206061]|uniref:hypothetical protein n=1 Tax=Micromonospora sp. CPCC 206061 TaxID=3122410 RepID=UPI002FF0981A
MPDPLMVAVATAVAGKLAEGISDAGRTALASLSRFVRDKMRGDPKGAVALEAAQAQPDNAAIVEWLAIALDEACARDRAFRDELARLWTATRDGGVANTISGSVHGPVVQARDVHGDIRFGGAPGP